MVTTNWGMLAKSAVDSETIEQAIARLILEHESDETSHLEVGESLQSHKASEIIDHLALSIIADKLGDREVTVSKLNRDKFYLEMFFESIDGYIYEFDPDGAISATLCLLVIKAGPTIDSRAGVGAGGLVGCVWAKNPSFQIFLRLPLATSQNAYFGMGGSQVMDSPPVEDFAGFYIENGTLYAQNSNDGNITSTEITGIDITENHAYRIATDYGTDIKFYVDDVLKATHSTNLPTFNGDNMFSASIKNTAAANRWIYGGWAIFFQDW